MAVKAISEKQFVVEPGSILEGSFNLVCSRGHRHFSPEPMTYVGLSCGYRGATSTTGCPSKLMFMRDSRIVNPPKKKSKLRKMKRF